MHGPNITCAPMRKYARCFMPLIRMDTMTIATETMPAPDQPITAGEHISTIAEDIYREVISDAIADKVDEALIETLERLLVPVVRKEDLKRKIYLTEKEVSELYSITPDALRTMRCRNRGDLAYIRDGRRILYPQKELQKYFEAKIKKGR